MHRLVSAFFKPFAMKIKITDKKVKVTHQNRTYTIVFPKQNEDKVVAKTISHAIKTLDNMVKKAKQHEDVKQTQEQISKISSQWVPFTPAPEPMYTKGAAIKEMPSTPTPEPKNDDVDIALTHSIESLDKTAKDFKKEKPCIECGSHFIPRGNRQVYCSEACKQQRKLNLEEISNLDPEQKAAAEDELDKVLQEIAEKKKQTYKFSK